VLDAFALPWNRARSYIHSPDPDYDAKLAVIATCLERARRLPETEVALYQDEATVERHPTLANAYAPAGSRQPLAQRSYRANTLTRLTATLDVVDGRVVAHRRSVINVKALVAFYQDLVAAYPDATRIWLLQDNWPVHTHPDVLVALEAQETPFPFHRPDNWPDQPHAWATKRFGDLHLPIQLVPLPTYASWANPIEKLWRKLKQELLHLHPLADDLPALRQAIDDFLAAFAHASPDLLRYVGLGDVSMAC
jgi:transposase